MATASQYHFDWSELAFASKKPLSNLQATFIAAPRELSVQRFTELVKTYLPQGNIVLGLAKESFVDGLDGQPQFRMLQRQTVERVISKVNASASKYNIYTLEYSQRELVYIIEKLEPRRAVFVNGSWYRAFHLRPEYYTLINQQIPYELVSPFTDEQEARDFAASITLPTLPIQGQFTEQAMMDLAAQAATHSFDWGGFQTAAALGRKNGKSYELLLTAHNNVVPFETYAMHYGSSRERNFSPPHDLNHYDTVHFEVMALIEAQKRKLDLANTTLFMNVLSCPTCARMFTQTDIEDFVYGQDHSDGYAVKMLESAGKKVRRLVL